MPQSLKFTDGLDKTKNPRLISWELAIGQNKQNLNKKTLIGFSEAVRLIFKNYRTRQSCNCKLI